MADSPVAAFAEALARSAQDEWLEAAQRWYADRLADRDREPGGRLAAPGDRRMSGYENRVRDAGPPPVVFACTGRQSAAEADMRRRGSYDQWMRTRPAMKRPCRKCGAQAGERCLDVKLIAKAMRYAAPGEQAPRIWLRGFHQGR